MAHEGGNWLRRWRVSASGDASVLDVWTHARGFATLLALLIGPAALGAWLFSVALETKSSVAFVAGVLVPVIGVPLAVGLLVLGTRERVRLTGRDLTITRRRRLLFREVRIELLPGMRFEACGDVGGDSVALVGGDRRETFGWGLGRREAQHVVVLLGRALGPAEPVVDDGVVRRAARRRDSDGSTPDSGVRLESHPPLHRPYFAAFQDAGHPFRRSKIKLKGGMSGRDVSVAVIFAVLVGMGGGVTTAIVVGALGLGLLISSGPGGIREALARRRTRAARRGHPHEPWLWEDAWRGGITTRSEWGRLSALGLGLCVTGFLVVNRHLWISGNFTDWILLAALGSYFVWLAYRAQNLYFAGTTEVRFPQMPARPGETLAVDFAVARRGATFREIRFVLMRIVERARVGKPVNEVYFTHRAAYQLPEDQFPPLAGEQVRAVFQLPADAGDTDLWSRTPRYWELTVSGKTNCGDYEERFLVPVFAEPAPDPANEAAATRPRGSGAAPPR